MELTKEDYIIICGDFGLCWAKDKTFEYHCKNFAEKPYTILWVQGNHENYDMIGEYPLEEWHGGKARHIIRDKVILLERGQVFEIDGKTFFTFGGASSHDIQGGILDRQTVDFAEQKRRADRNYLPYRILQESWWPQELPTEGELQAVLRSGSADRLSGDFGTEAALQALVFRPLSPGLSAGWQAHAGILCNTAAGAEGKCECGAGTGKDRRRNKSWQEMRM